MSSRATPLAGGVTGRRVSAVLFDVDQTLTDYESSARAGIIAHCAELGVPSPRLPAAAGLWFRLEQEHFPRYLAGELTFADQRRHRALGMRRALGGRGPGDPDAWFAAYLVHYEANLALFDDVPGCLDALSGLTLGVISNNDVDYTRTKLALTGIADRFAIAVGRDTYGAAKPSPVIFGSTCAALGVSAAETVYVGDSLPFDAQGATDAGLTGVWLDRSCGLPRFARQISTLAELPGLLGLTDPGSDLKLAEGVG
ncbi:HAD family hydrolase [Longispora fulva]|uniref:Putative hydrolase of the HAD superfamily n=1 Tax=Longispora fulva TaxID=619741 RepID=A0A8J7GPJ3_9ACTN|nr:HAD family hydrolase [Longispora fulva]MBG6141037.1 putative hydrolase of the HAD superfamily [Longispora fulva]GIG60693.1 HAD family hydrolase [Longispora fulva]